MDVHCHSLDYIMYLQQHKNPRVVAQTLGVTHAGFDDIDITFTPIYLLKTQSNGVQLVGHVQLSY